jgi:hypothetical protein
VADLRSLLRSGLLTVAQCREALAIMRSLPVEPALLESGPSDERRGSVAWLPREGEHAWLFDTIERFGLEFAARRGIEASSLGDALQFARYDSNSRFEWHIDTGSTETRLRKVTVSVQLSGGAAYGGGDLEFVGERPHQGRRELGSATAFPAVLGHRVTPIEWGTRVAVVGWICGTPYT